MQTPFLTSSAMALDLGEEQLDQLRDVMPRALAVSGLATKGDTYYNSGAEQRALVGGCIAALMAIDRGLAAASAVLPGVKDFWRGAVVASLLGCRREGDALLTSDEEMAALTSVFKALPPHRMLNLCQALRATRVNNARTRRLILGTILTSPKIELWGVKYRGKLRRALEHAWGKRRATWMAANMEGDGVLPEVLKYVFGRPFEPTLPLLRAVAAAPEDFERLRELPFEVAKGFWSQHHRDRPFGEVLELTARTMTGTQRQRVQRQAERHEVVVEWDPFSRTAVELYVYGFERGATDEIRQALDRRAAEAARRLDFGYATIGVVVDNSASMLGGQDQKNRPLATAYALRDALQAAATDRAIVRSTGDGRRFAVPRGETDLATAFLEVLREGPEAVFVITDGYENAPSGRMGEVLHRARQMGIGIPVFQVATVAAAEAGSVRRVSRTVPVLALSDAKAMSTAILAETFRTDPGEGVRRLLGLARSELGLGERPTMPLLAGLHGAEGAEPEPGAGLASRVQYRVGPHTYRGDVQDRDDGRVRIRRTHRRLSGDRWVPSLGDRVITRREESVEVLR